MERGPYPSCARRTVRRKGGLPCVQHKKRLPCPTSSADSVQQQSTAIMSSNYPSTPYSNHPAHLPARPNYFSNYDPRTNSLVASNPYSTQYRTDAYGRQLPPGPAPPHSGNGFSPSQPGRPQTLPSCAQPYVLNEQYRQDVNINHDIPRYAPANMTRGSSSRSYGTEGDSPQSQRSSEGPKE